MRHELGEKLWCTCCMQCCGPVTHPIGCSAICNAEGVKCNLGLVMLWCAMLCAHNAAYWNHYRCNAVGMMHDLAHVQQRTMLWQRQCRNVCSTICNAMGPRLGVVDVVKCVILWVCDIA